MKKHKKKQSALWQATAPSGTVSYLFGTMHVRDLRAFRWLEMAKKCVAECSAFATEFDFADADQAALTAALSLPEGTDLEQCLSRQAWRNLDRYARQKLGASADLFRHQHPMAVSTALNMAFLSEEAPLSLDETLWEHARSLGVRTTGVESFNDQLDTIQRIGFEQHTASLTWLLKNYRRQKQRLRKMLARYAQGDIQGLYKSAKKDAKGMRKVLLYRRNKLMAKRFAEIASQEPLFCAVGAGHLAGNKGMLRLLKNAGFSLRPVLP